MVGSLLPEELLVSVLKIGELSIFKAPSHFLHRAVYNFRKNPKFQDVLRPFRFSGSPAAPFSEVLENALFNLQYSNKLKRVNPDLIEYQTSEETDKYYSEVIEPKIDPALKLILSELANNIKGLKTNSC